MFQSVTGRMAVQEQVTARAALLEDLLARLPLEAARSVLLLLHPPLPQGAG